MTDREPGSGRVQGASKFREPVTSTVHGEESLPTATAPLMYIDDRRQVKEILTPRSESSEEIARPRGAKAKRAIAAFNNYLDQRA
jgi:hypothetical protein